MFLQYFDTVDWVFRPVKTVSHWLFCHCQSATEWGTRREGGNYIGSWSPALRCTPASQSYTACVENGSNIIEFEYFFELRNL